MELNNDLVALLVSGTCLATLGVGAVVSQHYCNRILGHCEKLNEDIAKLRNYFSPYFPLLLPPKTK